MPSLTNYFEIYHQLEYLFSTAIKEIQNICKKKISHPSAKHYALGYYLPRPPWCA